jgi:hypothetical protein
MKKNTILILIIACLLTMMTACSGATVKGGVLLKEGTVKKISVTSQPEGYDYSFSGDDVQSVVNYLSELNLTSEYSENPDGYDGMTWVISLEYESGDTLMIYHFGNMFIRTAGSSWYKMTYEEASRFGKLIGELSK